MAVPTLSAELRESKGTTGSKQLRRGGVVPGVIYGRGEESRNIKVDRKIFDKIVGQFGASSMVSLTLDGEILQTNIQDVQRDPLSQQVIHVDFRHLISGQAVKIRIPIILHNTEEFNKKGILIGQNISELEVHCMPKDIMQSIDIDASKLTVHVPLTVGDLDLPDTIEPLHELDETVVLAYINRISEEEESEEEEVIEPVFDKGASDEE